MVADTMVPWDDNGVTSLPFDMHASHDYADTIPLMDQLHILHKLIDVP